MVYDPARVAEPTGRAHWPLDANVDVVVVAEKVSKDLNDLKVSITQASYLIYHSVSSWKHPYPGLMHPDITQHTGTTWSPPRSTRRPRPIAHIIHPDITQHTGTTWSPLRTTRLCVTPSSCPQTSVLPEQDSVATLT